MKKLLLALLAASACALGVAQERQLPYRVEALATSLEHPWSVAFLPDGRLLVTERVGRLRVIEGGTLRPEPVAGLPEIFVSGQGGLFDVLPAPDFDSSALLYLSFAHGDKDANHTRVVRARLQGNQLLEVTPIFTSQPAKSGDAHFGGRMLWLPDGTLMMGLGDGFYFREDAQRLNTHLAKIIRIHADGSVPQDNPFVKQTDVRPEIYSYGHRHVQALVHDSASGRLYAHEHGPRGGDEINVIQPGRNYGWPLITYGRDYSRALISPFTEREGMEQPLLYWTPSIAPGGMALYDGNRFPKWQGSLFVAALAEKSVRRVPLGPDGQPQPQEVLFKEVGQRMRDVRVGPDGALYLLTDEKQGQLLRVLPAVEP
jgi:aldose sugar dehydrogenase